VYSSTHSLTSILYGGEWSASRPGRFTPRKEPQYPLDRRLGGLYSRSGRGGEEKNSQTLPGLEPPIIQPVVQRYITELSRLLYTHTWIRFCHMFILLKEIINLCNNAVTCALSVNGSVWIMGLGGSFISEGSYYTNLVQHSIE
jgi:hypothetical protein